jgi:ATP-dependent DNA ligase
MKDTDFLFKRDSRGEIRCWTAYVNDQHNVTMLSGLYTGELVENVRLIEPKNVGKSNETSQLEQAQKEVEALRTKKMKQGYISLTDKVKYIETAQPSSYGPIYRYAFKASDGNTFKSQKIPQIAFNELLPVKSTKTHNDGKIKPMLAKKWQDYGSQFINESVYVQPKLDGFRCITEVVDGEVKMYSRTGEKFNLSHISAAINQLCKDHNIENIIFDGEIYNHDMSLQEISSAVKKPNLNTSRLQYHIYDIVDDRVQRERLNHLHTIFSQRRVVGNVLHNVLYIFTGCEYNNIKALRDGFIIRGYEGAIIRIAEAAYEQKRSKSLLKYKKPKYAPFTIHRITQSSRRKGYPIIHLYNNLNKETFKASYDGTTEERQALWDKKEHYYGEIVLVEYFERTAPPKELPFHARVIDLTYRPGIDYDKLEDQNYQF